MSQLTLDDDDDTLGCSCSPDVFEDNAPGFGVSASEGDTSRRVPFSRWEPLAGCANGHADPCCHVRPARRAGPPTDDGTAAEQFEIESSSSSFESGYGCVTVLFVEHPRIGLTIGTGVSCGSEDEDERSPFQLGVLPSRPAPGSLGDDQARQAEQDRLQTFGVQVSSRLTSRPAYFVAGPGVNNYRGGRIGRADLHEDAALVERLPQVPGGGLAASRQPESRCKRGADGEGERGAKRLRRTDDDCAFFGGNPLEMLQLLRTTEGA